MSLPKKGSRSVEVDGVRYRWLIRRKPTYGQAIGESGLTVVVELEEPGATLVVELDVNRPDAWIEPGQISVTPRDIALFVRAGLARGWTPALAGKTIKLRSSEVV